MNQRALEAGARALCIAVGDDPDQLTYAHEMRCTGHDREPMHRWGYWTVHSEAVITAYEAHLKAEGFVVVPRDDLLRVVAIARRNEAAPEIERIRAAAQEPNDADS